MSFEEFQNGRRGDHLGYQNGTILTILNLHVATMPPTKFQLNPCYGSGGDVENVKKLTTDGRSVPISKMVAMVAILKFFKRHLPNYKSD